MPLEATHPMVATPMLFTLQAEESHVEFTRDIPPPRYFKFGQSPPFTLFLEMLPGASQIIFDNFRFSKKPTFMMNQVSIVNPQRKHHWGAASDRRRIFGVGGSFAVCDQDKAGLCRCRTRLVVSDRMYRISPLPGARYGTWGVRGLKAWEQLHPHRASESKFVGVEPFPEFQQWFARHVVGNRFSIDKLGLNQSP